MMSADVNDSREHRMDTHKNARLTPKRREDMVRAVVDGGLSNAAAARRFNTTPKTVAKWVARFKAEGVDGLRDRSSKSQSSPSQIPVAIAGAVERLRRERHTQEHYAAELGISKASTLRIKPNPFELLAFRPLIFMSGSQRRSRCVLSAGNMSRRSNPEVHADQREAGVPQLCESRPPPRELVSTSVRPLRARRSSMAWVGRLVMIVLLPAIIGFLVAKLPVSTFWEWQAGDRTFELASSSSQLMKDLPAQRTELEPRLVAHRSSGMSGEPVPLGLTLRGSVDGGAVMIAGLVPGMSLSSGSAVGANAWQVPATDLANTWVGPPQNFVGEVELIAELHLADATIAHRQSIRIEWIAATAAGPEQASVVPIPSSPADPEEMPIESSPERTRESQCDYRACARAHRSFRASDCTYRPYRGRRRLCEKGARPTEVLERPSQVSTETRTHLRCNFAVCARFYPSFDPSDCTYQPHYGGARRTCGR
jgi:transposase-like protein